MLKAAHSQLALYLRCPCRVDASGTPAGCLSRPPGARGPVWRRESEAGARAQWSQSNQSNICSAGRSWIGCCSSWSLSLSPPESSQIPGTGAPHIAHPHSIQTHQHPLHLGAAQPPTARVGAPPHRGPSASKDCSRRRRAFASLGLVRAVLRPSL